jgi:ABC-type transport system involved in multi-copper enzyme maturation permease subunit
MNTTLVLAYWRQRLTSPMRVVIAFTLLSFGLMAVALSRSVGMLGKEGFAMLAFTVSAGLIGQDVSSGVLTLAFARPVRRSEYVLSRWFAAGTLATALIALQVVLAVAIVMLRGGEVDTVTVVSRLLHGTVVAFGAAAVLTLFSSLVPGFGDLGLYLLATIALSVLGGLAMAQHLDVVGTVVGEVQRMLDASFDPTPLLGHAKVAWYDIVTYASTVTLALAGAIVVMNRKELSYAAG